MAEVFAGAVMQVLFEKLASGGINQILKHVKGKKKIDRKTISKLDNSLKMVAAMLIDAQQRRIQSAAYTAWVEELQDSAFDLEDILDEFATDAQLLQLQQAEDDDNRGRGASKPRNVACLQSARSMVKSILTCGRRAAQRFHSDGSGDDLPSKIEAMISRLEESRSQGLTNLGLSVSVNVLQEKHNPAEATMHQTLRETTSFVQRTPYGRDNRKKEIIQKLLREEPSSSENYVVIAIVGNGGIGKTTLAQYVYNDPQVNDHFKFKAWVCVSDEAFDVARVTRDIINSATWISGGAETLDRTQRSLIDEVKNKRFLIVVDDVWTEKYDDWCKLWVPFQYGALGSRVIVTTRNEDVAKMMVTSENPAHFVINLENLSGDDCWRIFLQHLGLPNDQNVDDDLAKMQNGIIRKCDGLPLAAKALGGLFKVKVSHTERQNLLDSPIWDEKDEKANVLSVLRLSYFHLPPYLKHIFAYSSIFPKDYAFGETEVVLLWMAQGFLPENREQSMEVIGHRYFFELVSRSLFEPSPSREERYVMHDLVHDLSQWAAGDVCRCIIDAKDMSRNGLLSRTRHLNLWSNVTDPIDQTVTQKLRTFISKNKAYVDGLSFQFRDFISRIHCMRTLFLASETITELPECIGDLKHLRYLDLKFPKIRVLPKSIGNLCNLQMLFLTGCDNLSESIDFGFLVKLRHLRFPRSLWEATPLGIRKLTNLQTLGDMYLGADHGLGSIIKDLKNLNNLHGKLKVIGLEKVRKVEDAREVRLHEKTGIEKLHLRWSGDGEYGVDDDTKRDVLEQLKPNSCSKSYKLKGYSGLTLPSWLGDTYFENMVEVKLVNCEKCEWLPPLGHLPSLKKLWVERMKVLAGWLHGEKGTFSCLEELVIEYCESFQGSLLSNPPCLKILRIKYCPKA